MNFFISWSRSDPIYPKYFSKCNILISPINTLVNFKIGDWGFQPAQAIIDSGAYYYLSKKENLPPQKEVFKEQLRIIHGAKCPIYICHLDNPMMSKKANCSTTYHSIEKTLGNAYEFLSLFKEYSLDITQIKPLGAIQGNSKESIQFCARELKKMGFRTFGLGSLANLFNPEEIINRVSYASEVVGGENLHIFGISRMDIIHSLQQYNILSLDSTRPMKAAIYQSIFYSKPFLTYGIRSSKISSYFPRLLDEPLPCNCPSCQNDPSLIIETGTQRSNHARAIHNYFHLLHHLSEPPKLRDIGGI